MRPIKPGDIIRNERGWQGQVVDVSHSARFGTQVLVQYASTRRWEYRSLVEKVADGRDETRRPEDGN